MGLFRHKQTVDPVDFLALRAELQDVKSRLEASEQAKAYLEARLGSLDATTTALSSTTITHTQEVGHQLSALLERVSAAESGAAQVATLEQRVVDVEQRQATPVDPSEELAPKLSQLATRLEEVAQLVAATPGEMVVNGEPVHFIAEPSDELLARLDMLAEKAGTVDRLALQVESLNGRVAAQAAVSGEIDILNERIGQLQAHAGQADEVRLRVDQLTEQLHSTDSLAAQLAQLAERVALSANDAREAREQATALDARISGVGTELANQLSELGKEIDALAARQDDVDGQPAMHSPISEEVLATLRAGQTRLANEQARYEIAFREDLATLAEQVRLLRGR